MAILHLARLTDNAIEPSKATNYSACYDLHADLVDRNVTVFTANNEKVVIDTLFSDVVIPAGGRALIPTGWKMQPSDGLCIKFYPRSGLACKHGITLANAVGVIDRDFPDETMVLLVNTSEVPFTVNNQDRVAQLELDYVMPFDIKQVTELPPLMSNREGGFGSTGE